MKTGDQRCTDFLLEAMTFHLMTSEQKAKHCRNVSHPLYPDRRTVRLGPHGTVSGPLTNFFHSEYPYEAENSDRIAKNTRNCRWSGTKSNKES